MPCQLLVDTVEPVVDLFYKHKNPSMPGVWDSRILSAFPRLSKIKTKEENKNSVYYFDKVFGYIGAMMSCNTHPNARAFVYAFRFEEWIKVGHTINLEQRLSQLKRDAKNRFDAKLSYRTLLIPCSSDTKAQYLEESMHRSLDHYKEVGTLDWYEGWNGVDTILLWWYTYSSMVFRGVAS